MMSIGPTAAGAGRLRSLRTTGLRWLYLTHRWLGIFTCLLCAVWFISGLVMVYVPYPGLSDRDRMIYSEPLSLERVAITPGEALGLAGVKTFPTQIKLAMLRGQPVYRMVDGKARIAVSAVDGRPVAATTPEQAEETVRRLLPDHRVGPAQSLFNDQWTVARDFDPHRPLLRVPVRGAAGLSLYVSSKTGEVVNDTTRRERGWNWLGSIPHWIYLTVIREDNERWRQVIMWTSGPALVGAVAGAWIGVLRMRLKSGQPLSPYLGWIQWHHLAGLIGGLFAILWLFSGWLSVNPFHLFPRRDLTPAAMSLYAGHKDPTYPVSVGVLRGLPLRDAREARFIWVGGRPLIALMGPDRSERVIDGQTGAPAVQNDAALFRNARALAPGAKVAFTERLTREDSYWYSTRRDQRRLPVLRVGFADPAGTWVHIDPATGDVLGRSDRGRRLYRWLFNAIHAWDLPVFRGSDLARQMVIWVLSTAGLVLSVSGVVVGWRHVKLKAGVRSSRRIRKFRPNPNARTS